MSFVMDVIEELIMRVNPSHVFDGELHSSITLLIFLFWNVTDKSHRQSHRFSLNVSSSAKHFFFFSDMRL